MTENIIEMLPILNEKNPDKKILYFGNIKNKQFVIESFTYRDIQIKSNIIANNLTNLGIKPFDKIILMVPVCEELYLILIAIFKIGATVVIIEPSLDLKQIDYCCKITEPKAFIGIRKAHILRLISTNFRKIPIKIVVKDKKLINEYDFTDLSYGNEDKFNIFGLNGDEDALITFTSGSTGVPKGIQRTHNFLKIQMGILHKILDFEPDDIEMTNLPIFVLNNLGCNVPTVLPFIKKYLLKYIDPKIILTQLTQINVNRLSGSPYFIKEIINHCVKNNIKLDNIKKIFTGGGPVETDLINSIKNISNCKTKIVYGSTEAEPISLIEEDELLKIKEEKGVCVGKIIDDIKLEILQITQNIVSFIDNNKNDLLLKTNQIGEIIVKGENVNKFYYKNEKAIKENKIFEKDGSFWHRTGDIGYIDQNNNLWIVGRKSQAIFYQGHVLNNFYIENKINKIVGITKSAIIQKDHKTIILFIEKNRNFTKNKCFDEISDVLKEFDLKIDKIKTLNKLPLDKRHNTKVDYGKLLKID